MNYVLMLLSCGCGIISITEHITSKNKRKAEAHGYVLFCISFMLAYAAALV